MHTQMSQMDGMTSAKDLIKRAMKWGMKSIAITDHGVVQAFPEAHKLLGFDNKDMKVIYGVEAYLVPDKTPCVSFPKGQDIDTTYCVLDLETTGFSFRTEKITEVGIMKFKNGEVIDEFSCFVNPEKPIPQRVIEVTNITDDMVKDAETIEKVMPKIIEFVGDSVLVAHNADFDIGFLKYNAYPAKIFMGDTGSLAIGGAISTVAIILEQPLLIIIVGGVYVFETLSVIIQVTSFKLTGKRVFKMAPVHHHFEKCGWSEIKIVTVFSLITAVLCLIGFLAL